MYPNQYGYAQDGNFSITFSEFHEIAMKYDAGKPYRALETEHDWSFLFNKELIVAVNEAKEKSRIAKERDRMAHRVKIPDELLELSPNMKLKEVRIDLIQRYGASSVSLERKNGKYRLYHKSSASTLSNPEAV